jgi:hypothetical protein
MHDVEMARPQFAQQLWQRPRGRRLNVMQHEDAPALAFKPGEHPSRNLIRRNVLPIVAFKIGTPGHDAVRRQMLLERRRAT